MSDTPNADEFLDTLFSIPAKEQIVQQDQKHNADGSPKPRNTALERMGRVVGAVIALAFGAVVVAALAWVFVEIVRQIP